MYCSKDKHKIFIFVPRKDFYGTNITSNKNFFTRDMVGMPIRLRKTAVGSSASNAIGWATITEYVSPTKVVGLVEEQFFEKTYYMNLNVRQKNS